MEANKVPDKFPDGCRFGMDLNDGDGVELVYVEFPDGKRFAVDERDPSAGMSPTPRWPLRWSEISEADFLSAAGKPESVVRAAREAAAADARV